MFTILVYLADIVHVNCTSAVENNIYKYVLGKNNEMLVTAIAFHKYASINYFG